MVYIPLPNASRLVRRILGMLDGLVIFAVAGLESMWDRDVRLGGVVMAPLGPSAASDAGTVTNSVNIK